MINFSNIEKLYKVSNPLFIMKRGQGTVIGVVLLILIIVAAIAIITTVIIPLVREGGEETETGLGTISTDMEIRNVDIFLNGEIDITVHRGSDNNEITELKFIFYEEGGQSKIVTRSTDLIDPITSKVFSFDHSEILNENPIEKVSVVPVLGSELGIEVRESDSNILTNRDGERIYKNPDGLISWWKFDGNLRDSVNVYHGTEVGGTDEEILVEDVERGQVASFDGSDDYVKLNVNLADIDLYGGASGASTLSAWINEDDAREYNYIFNDVAGSRYFNSESATAPDFPTLFTRVRNSGDTSSPPYRSDGKMHEGWAFVALVVDCSVGEISFYIDGELDTLHSLGGVGCVLKDFQPAELPAIAKGLNPGNPSFFKGKIDDAMIFNRALSADEIKAIYINQKK